MVHISRRTDTTMNKTSPQTGIDSPVVVTVVVDVGVGSLSSVGSVGGVTGGITGAQLLHVKNLIRPLPIPTTIFASSEMN